MYKTENIEKVTLKDVDWKHINLKTIKGLYYNYKEVINCKSNWNR